MGKVKDVGRNELQISLHDPGLTPILRAGLGGLATAAVALGPNALHDVGSVNVDRTSVTLRWNTPGNSEPLLQRLFEACFRIDAEGLIRLVAYCDGDPSFEVRVAITDALRLTFLQHGKFATKVGAPQPRTFEIDDVPKQILVQPYAKFAHQTAWQDIAKSLDAKPGRASPIVFASWGNPGAVERHVGLGSTDIEYSPAEALCACFAVIGCLSLQGPNRSGVLIIPEPTDLLLFAEARPMLGPRSKEGCIVASPGDGVLALHAQLRVSDSVRELADGVGAISAVLLRGTAWASQLKSRTDTLIADRYDKNELAAFVRLMRICRTRIVLTAPKRKGEPGGYWGVPSALRGFVANNIARKKRFYDRFATMKTSDDPPRWMHRYYSSSDQLGALRFPDDKEGLIAMLDSLDDAERRLVASVHSAMRQRFGAIAEENEGNTAARKKRTQGEREKWRLAFSGARTHEQIRHALADLWSRAGTIPELQGNAWHALQPLLAANRWEAARDLALVALASYQGKEAVDANENEESEGETE